MSEVSGNFEIIIRGTPFSQYLQKKLINNVEKLARKIDYKVKFYPKYSMMVAYELRWWGIPENFGEANSLLKFLDEDVGKYLKEWTTVIKMQLKESGG